MKKLIALLLALVMVLSLVACGASTETAEETAAEETAEETKEEETKEEAAEEASAEEEVPQWKVDHPTWLCEEKTEITVMTYDGVTNAYLPPSDDVYFWQWVEEKTNVHVVWDIIPYSSYQEVSSARVAAGTDLADVMHFEKRSDMATFLQTMYDNGYIIDLAEHEDWMPYTIEYWNSEDALDIPYFDLITNADGQILAYRSCANPTNNRITALWNKQWMDQLGLEIPETLDEFYDVLVAMKEAGDLNGNGEDDEIPLTSADMAYILPYFGAAFDVHQYEDTEYSNYWEDGDGEIYDERTTDKMKETLTFINKLYEEELLDQEITSLNYDFTHTSELSAMSRYGCVIMYYSFASSYGTLINQYYDADCDTSAQGLYIGTGLASDANGNVIQSFKNTSVSMSTVITNGEKAEIAAKWVDFVVASEEALRERCYGPEGIGWQWDENGEFEVLLDENGDRPNLNDYGCGQIALVLFQTDDQLMSSSMTPAKQWYVDAAEAFAEKTTFFQAPVPGIATLEEEQEILDTYVTDLSAYYKEMRNKFVTGEADIDAEWDTYVSTMQKLGSEEVTEAYQMMYDRTH